MKIFVKILQVLLALWSITGAVYMMQNHAYLANAWATSLPTIFWVCLGLGEIILASGLLLSAVGAQFRKYAAPSAYGLAALSLMGIALYSAFGSVTGALWAIIPVALYAVIIYHYRNQV